ncbi:MAG: aminoacyl-tRNA hydrolase [Desulfobulbus propionicus]|nr:MAG: aminoacyl-tRNA hydrolase [Desulfobulbus propionicus]PIE69878.1 MAG: aminoacyl-tRNA hydrolase [Deltaproteobacteria bacterium]
MHIAPTLHLPFSELEFRFSRSSGPGGQNVNKVNSRVTLLFDVKRSPFLTEQQKIRIVNVLGGRVSKAGVLQLSSSEHRTQSVNKEAVIARFRALLAQALVEQKKRKRTKPSRAAKERRIAAKKKRAQLKSQRKHVGYE